MPDSSLKVFKEQLSYQIEKNTTYKQLENLVCPRIFFKISLSKVWINNSMKYNIMQLLKLL